MSQSLPGNAGFLQIFPVALVPIFKLHRKTMSARAVTLKFLSRNLILVGRCGVRVTLLETAVVSLQIF